MNLQEHPADRKVKQYKGSRNQGVKESRVRVKYIRNSTRLKVMWNLHEICLIIKSLDPLNP
jgi:hypothetical protein